MHTKTQKFEYLELLIYYLRCLIYQISDFFKDLNTFCGNLYLSNEHVKSLLHFLTLTNDYVT